MEQCTSDYFGGFEYVCKQTPDIDILGFRYANVVVLFSQSIKIVIITVIIIIKFYMKISKCYFETNRVLCFQGDQGIGMKGEPGKPGQTGSPGPPGPPGGFSSPPMKVSLIPSRMFAEQNCKTGLQFPEQFAKTLPSSLSP